MKAVIIHSIEFGSRQAREELIVQSALLINTLWNLAYELNISHNLRQEYESTIAQMEWEEQVNIFYYRVCVLFYCY